MRKVDLSSKEAYLAWVEEWKVEWHDMVEKIRDAKRRKNHHRDRIRSGQGTSEDFELMIRAWGARQYYGWLANHLIELRHEGKRESWACRISEISQTAGLDIS